VDPIRKLMDEHRVIESVLDAVAAYGVGLRGAGESSREDLGRFVTFIREYADAYHHGKEEDMLFRVMVEAGVPVDGGPIAVMLAEHDEGRRYVGALAGIAGGEGPLTDDEKTEIDRAAGGYVNLLRAHIMKEDEVLYPMARRVLPPDVMAGLSAEFVEYESREAATADRLVALARDLAAKYPGRA